jgi:hypothetical protein
MAAKLRNFQENDPKSFADLSREKIEGSHFKNLKVNPFSPESNK